MPMPEASMHKNDRFVFGKDNIRFSRQSFIVKFVAKPLRMQKPAYQHLRPGILRFYLLHIKATLFCCVYISHNKT